MKLNVILLRFLRSNIPFWTVRTLKWTVSFTLRTCLLVVDFYVCHRSASMTPLAEHHFENAFFRVSFLVFSLHFGNWPFSHLISSSGHLWFASCSILPSNWQRSHFASKFSTSFLTVKLVFSSLDIGVRQLGQCFATPWYCTRTRQSLQYVWPHSGIIAGKIISWWLQT